MISKGVTLGMTGSAEVELKPGAESRGAEVDGVRVTDTLQSKVPPSEADIERTAQLLFRELDSKTECVELRVFSTLNKESVPKVAYAATAKEFVRLVAEVSEWKIPVYAGVNPRQRERYELAPGTWVPAAECCSGEEHVTRRIWLSLDCNPVRAAGFEKHNASDAERNQMRTAMKALVIGLPGSLARADSGNGQYVLVRVELPNTQEVKSQTERYIHELQTRFNGPHLQLGSTTDAAQVIKVAGTPTYSEPSSSDRPMRVSNWLTREMTLPVNDAIRSAISAGKVDTTVRPRSVSVKQPKASLPPVVAEEDFPDEWFLEGPVPEKLETLIAADEKFRTRWNGDTDGLDESSTKAMDLSIATVLAGNGFSANEIYRSLRTFKHGSKNGSAKESRRNYGSAIHLALENPGRVGLQHFKNLSVLGFTSDNKVAIFCHDQNRLRVIDLGSLRYIDLVLIAGREVGQRNVHNDWNELCAKSRRMV